MQREQKIVLFLSVALLILMVVLVHHTKWVEAESHTASYIAVGTEQSIQKNNERRI